jgi:large-conductance mechanosensitive channel
MEKIDARNLILGVFLSITAAGFYDSVFYSSQSKTIEAYSSALASLVTFIITGIYFWVFFLRAKNKSGLEPIQALTENKKKEKEKKELEQPQETEQEKLKREFKQRVIA